MPSGEAINPVTKEPLLSVSCEAKSLVLLGLGNVERGEEEIAKLVGLSKGIFF